MKKAEKEVVVSDLNKLFREADLAVLADFCGLTVAQMTGLRSSLRKAGAEIRVVKNTLAKRSLQDMDLDFLKSYFVGNTALITSFGDPVGPAKVLMKSVKDYEKLKVKVGTLSGKKIESQGLELLSNLPSRNELLSSLAGSLKSPAQKFVGVLTAVQRNLLNVLVAIQDSKK